MPNLDGTGPMGLVPQTGVGAGRRNLSGRKGVRNCMRRIFCPRNSFGKKDKLEALKKEKEIIEEEIKELEKEE